MSESLLNINNLKVIYKTDLETVYAVNNISFSLNKGETLGLVGETGAGKTTTALTIMGLLPERIGQVCSGSVTFEGEDIVSMPESQKRQMRGEKIAMIFQDPMTSLNPVLTVEEQIGETLAFHNNKMKQKEIDNRVDEVLNLVGISKDRKYEYPHQFSGGMRQRVVIAMALACQPDLLIADEPTTALDVTIQAQVLKMMRSLRDKLGTSMIMITHDLGIVTQVCDNVAVMYAGEILEIGTLDDIFNHDKKHHPYTVGLFGSIPKLREKTKRLNPIPGLMSDPTSLPEGCKFWPRCPHYMEICKIEHPNYYIDGTHKISCHLFCKEDK